MLVKLLMLVSFYGGHAQSTYVSSQKKGDSRPILLTSTRERQQKTDVTLARNINEYLRRATPFGFSGVVLVAKDGKVILRKGYGIADKSKGVRNNKKTLFLIGSVSKQFTAAAILKLEMDGKLKTGDPIRMYLKRVPPDKADITIHQLLTHTSGLPTSYPNLGESPALDLTQAVVRTLDTPLASSVGSDYSYSNIGYLLLAGIVENVSKTPFREFLRQNFFRPARMWSTNFAGEVPEGQRSMVAHGYNRLTDWGTPDLRPTRKASFGFGDIISNVNDLYAWQLALQNDKVLSAAAKAKLFTPSVNVDEGVDYGYGWNISRTARGTQLVSHGGDASPEGWTADFRWYRDENVVTIILANEMRDTWGVVHPIEEGVDDIIFGTPHEMLPNSIYVARKQLGKYVGTYLLPSGGKFLIRSVSGKLTLSAEGQDAIDELISGQDDKGRKLFEDLNQRTAIIVEGISKNDYMPLKDSLHSLGIDLTLEKVKGRYGTRWVDWNELVETYGKFKGYEVLGTMPSYDNMATTHIRLNFEHGSTVYRWYWWHGGLERIYADDVLPAANPLVPQSKKLFASIDLFTNNKALIEFDLNSDGTVKDLSVGGRDVNERARKTE